LKSGKKLVDALEQPEGNTVSKIHAPENSNNNIVASSKEKCAAFHLDVLDRFICPAPWNLAPSSG
jgi:hypothetical protein